MADDPIKKRLAALEAENARLREMLRDYARHNEGCSAAFNDADGQPGYRCRCGWDRERATLVPAHRVAEEETEC